MPSNADTQDVIVVDGLSRLGRNNGMNTDSPHNSSPEPDHDGDGNTSASIDRRRSRRGPKTTGDQLEALRAMPELRPMPWKEGKELSLKDSIFAERVQTRGACLLATRGEVRNPPCSHCAKDVGRFSLCVASEDWFNGACATCQLATRSHLCDFRKPETLRVKVEGRSRRQDSKSLHSITRSTSDAKDTDTNGEQNLGDSSEEKSKSRIARSERANGQTSETSALDSPDNRKRKRKSEKLEQLESPKETLQPTHVWKPYTSPYLPPEPANSAPDPRSAYRTPLPSISTTYSSPYTLPSQSTSSSRPPEQPVRLNYVYQKEELHNGNRYQRIAQAPPPRLSPLQSNHSQSYYPSNGGTFTAVSNTRDRDATESLSPSTQLLQPRHNMSDQPQIPPKITIPSSNSPTHPNTTPHPTSHPSNFPETPLIDTLTRKKRQQIYSIIGGLQSGIRSCHQQAQNMQRQLNSLQAALGIDVEDEDNIAAVEKA